MGAALGQDGAGHGPVGPDHVGQRPAPRRAGPPAAHGHRAPWPRRPTVHEARLLLAAQAEAPALADRDQLDGVDLRRPSGRRRPRPVRGSGRCGTRGSPGARPPSDEADVLAVGLGRRAQAEGRGPVPHLGLGQVPTGSRTWASCGLAEHVEHVGLVLGAVGAPGRRDGVPSGRSTTRAWWPVAIASKPRARARSQEPVELQVAVALDARVRRAARGVGGDVRARPPGGRSRRPKLKTWWSMPSWSATRRASSTSATEQQPGVGLAAPELEGDAQDVVALLEQERRRRPTSRPRPTWRTRTLIGPPAAGRRRAGTTSRAAVDVGVGAGPAEREAQRARIACSRGTPMAARTCDGSAAPLAHDEAAEAHTPAWSSRNSSASASTPWKQTWARPAARPSGRRRRCRSPRRQGRRRAARRPGGRAGRRRGRCPRSGGSAVRPARGGHGDDAGHVLGAAAAVPLLARHRSDGRPSSTPGRTTRAPTPLGPPNLWALTEMRSAPAAVRRHVEPGQGLDGVGVEHGVGGMATDDLGHLGEGLDRADLVVDQHHRHHGHGIASSRTAARRRGRSAPSASTGADAAAERGRRVAHGVVLDGGGHDRAAPGRLGPEHGQVVGLGPAAGEHDLAGAGARAPRPGRRGRRRAPGGPPERRSGRPTGCPAASVRTRVISATASGRTGVVAAWSR